LKIYYTDIFSIPLPKNHSFPFIKYALLRSRIANSQIVEPGDLRIPKPASNEDIIRVHDPGYLTRLHNNDLTAKEIRRVGLPWSPEIVLRAKYSAGATIEACRAALNEGVGVNLGGGTHHAFYDHGQGYCWLNDSVIAIRALQAEGAVEKVLIIDGDVHQGNGTAAITKHDTSIFTFSIHGKNNFPYQKEQSDLDIALDDDTEDAAYLHELENGLVTSLDAFAADLVIYLAGADPFYDDQFGRLSLTKAGLLERDRIVFSYCDQAGLPIAVAMAGGYARQVKDSVDIHYQTVLAAADFQRLRTNRVVNRKHVI
jgi:acetoin utilization deacetylase AcuC-like enzyme